jgi:hypothetical protein
MIESSPVQFAHQTADSGGRAKDLLRPRLLAVGVAKNCEKRVEADILRLFESMKKHGPISWLIIESDSQDNTVEALSRLERAVPNFTFISLGNLSHALPNRTQRIAHCRNLYLEQLDSNPLYADIDYVVVGDLDGVNNLISPDGFESCWMRSGWDVCTANQRGPYYDIWALRHPIWSPNDCWKQFQFLLDHKVPREAALRAAVYSKHIVLAESDDWIEVESAFGGLAVYRRAVLRNVRYIGLDEQGDSVCEHVTLHRAIRKNGYKIFINPRFVNGADREHTRERTFLRRLRRDYRAIRDQAKSLFLHGFGAGKLDRI